MINPVTFNKETLVDRNNKHRPKKQRSATTEGVLVNNFIKTGYGTVYVSPYNNMPAELDMPKEEPPKSILKNPLLLLSAGTVGALGVGAVLSTFHKNSFIAKQNLKKAELLPNISRMITINDDVSLVLYLMVQDPTPKSVIAATGVVLMAAAGMIMKNFVDGCKEIWVKKQQAEAQKDLEKALIEIETKSFSGKTQIIRNMISKYARELNPSVTKPNDKEIEFTGSRHNDVFSAFTNQPAGTSFKQQKKDKKITDKNWFYAVVGAATIGASVLLGRVMFKNLGIIAKEYDNFEKTAMKEFKNSFVGVEKKEFKAKLNSMSAPPEVKNFITGMWADVNNENFIYESAPELMNGKPNATTVSSAVGDRTAFLYTYIMNPTPQTRNLMLLVCGASGLGYAGSVTVQGIKEAEVIKANNETEKQLQNKLVQVELNNFLAKKKSYIDPLIEDYQKFRTENPDKKEDIERMYINIIEETKSGPPFVYS